ncbi:MAG: hypothetical protein Q8Q60_03360 [Candidatus Chromulinivorax sp.]|nr:hypothetical protein [Candidatus Chromulinivorax sp.]
MNITKYVTLELKTIQDGPLYAIRNKSKATDLIFLLNYLFFEYTKKDLGLITKNLQVIDEEMDDEIVVHGTSRSIFLDLANPTNLYISLLADYIEFEDALTCNSKNLTFVSELKKKKIDHYKINRDSFLQLLQDWHTIIEKKPAHIILYEDKNGWTGFESFTTKESIDQYLQ